MPQYIFRCPSCKDENGDPSVITIFKTTVPKDVIRETTCSDCGGKAPRAFDLEIPSQAVIGLTPISKSTTVPGSLYNTVKHAFGAHDENDPNQAPFRDSGELEKFLNGNNDLGKPSIDQRTGKVRRRPDGSVIRNGAKLIKYDRNATPSKDNYVRQRGPSKSARWRGGEGRFESGAGGDIRITQ